MPYGVQAPMAPAAPAAPPAPGFNPYAAPGVYSTPAPTPVVVPINNAGGGTLDQLVLTAGSAAPIAAGIAPGKAAAGAIVEAKGHFIRASASRSARTSANASAAGRSALFGSVLSAVKSSVLINGIISVAVNGYMVATNKRTVADASGEVAGDLTSAVVGGAAGGVASAAGTFLLAGILGTGLPLTLAGMALGVAGYMVADTMLRQTPIFNQIKSSVRKMFGAAA